MENSTTQQHTRQTQRNANIPQELKDLKRWAATCRINGRKQPGYLNGGEMKWGTTSNHYRFAAIEKQPDIEFIIMPEDDIAGTDCDGCVHDGVIHPLVAEWCKRTYAEFSESRTGVKLYLKAHLPDFKKIRCTDVPWQDGDPHTGIEVFTKQPFHMTGDVVPGSPNYIADDPDLLAAILVRFSPMPRTKGDRNEDSYDRFVREHQGIIIEDFGDSAIIVCPWQDRHTTPSEKCTKIWKGPPHTFHCFHKNCDPHTWRDLRLYYDPHAYDKTNTSQGKERPKQRFVYASEVQEQVIEWLWEGRLARGELTLGVGDAGLGKSLTDTKIIAHITRGQALPGGPKIPPGGVILMSPEDSASRTIVPRLRAAGADLAKVLLLSEVDVVDLSTGETYKRPVSFPEDAYILREAIEEVGAVAVFIDPILSLISGKVDVYKNHAVRQALAQVMSTADKHGCAVLGIIHTTKGQHPNALFRSSSSTAFIEMARVALFFVPDPDGEADKSGVIVNHKNNLAERGPSIRYAIHRTADNIGYTTWEGLSNHTRDELLNQVAPRGAKSAQEVDLVAVLKANEKAMNVADILEQIQNGQTADALEIMLRRKVEQGILMKPARGLYTYAGNPLYCSKRESSKNNVGNVGNVGMSEMSESDLQPETDIKPTMSESKNAHNPASGAPLHETDISDMDAEGQPSTNGHDPAADEALERSKKRGRILNTPRNTGESRAHHEARIQLMLERAGLVEVSHEKKIVVLHDHAKATDWQKLILLDGHVIHAGRTPWEKFLYDPALYIQQQLAYDAVREMQASKAK